VNTEKDDLLDILIVDDEPSIRKMLAMWLECAGHRVTTAASPKEALATAGKATFDMAFVDLRLGMQNGMDLIPELRKQSPWMRIVVITAHAAISSAVEAMHRGAMDYLPKPFGMEQVELVVHRVAEVRRLERQVAVLQDAAGQSPPDLEITSKNRSMQQVFHRAQQVAKSEATVLLRGESGTGKGVLARLIHQWSSRREKAFGVVSCPSLSPELLESELFGHVKGAFTGAARDTLGRVATCDGGTLFLDEVGDLPLQLQPKLLRFIQDRQYERVGEAVTRTANVRVVAATNINLEDAIEAGAFREDLLYRLNVVQLQVPPLRERREDIVPLAERLLIYFAAQAHRPLMTFTAEARQVLEAHAWPGNVRELRNVVERAVIFAEGTQIGVESLGLHQTAKLVSPALGRLQSLEAMEEVHIQHVIGATASLEEAAKVLEIDIATLWRKRRKYGI
jgi:two-component system, NtrC family, response regulator AlgB